MLIGLSVVFVLFEAMMFYHIHIARSQLGFNLHYACIIGATCFAWLTLIVKLVTAKGCGERISELLFDKKEGNFIRIAMLFTLWADYYLVGAKETDNLAGVTAFLGTQLFIFLHTFFNDSNKKWRIANLITRIVLTPILIMITYLILGDSADRLAITSVIYYANLCANAIFAHRSGRGGLLLTAGLIFFALCDINVGLSALNAIYDGGFPEGSFLYNLLHSGVDLIWIFYIPSQTMIPLTPLLSGKKE